MTELLQSSSPVVDRERDMTMSKVNQTTLRSDIYTRIQNARISELDRRNAIHALQNAEAIVDAIFWVKGRITALGHAFLKPSLKH
jgi:hypothetical protein